MFAHIVVFLSFIYAIAITHPLASSHEGTVRPTGQLLVGGDEP